MTDTRIRRDIGVFYKNKKLLLLFIFLLPSLGGCQIYKFHDTFAPITGQELSDIIENKPDAAFGTKHSQEHYFRLIDDYHLTTHFDPDSILYRDRTGPDKCAFGDKNNPILGYCIGVLMNSKNRMGGYTGYKPQRFGFVNNSLVMYSKFDRRHAYNVYGDRFDKGHEEMREVILNPKK